MRVGRKINERNRCYQKDISNKSSLTIVGKGLRNHNRLQFSQTRSYASNVETNAFKDFQVGAQKLK